MLANTGLITLTTIVVAINRNSPLRCKVMLIVMFFVAVFRNLGIFKL